MAREIAATPPRRPSTPGPSLGQEVGALFFEILLEHKKIWQGVAKEFGLTLQQLAALRNVRPGEGLRMSALAEALSCDAASVTAVVDKLEARGLVRRAGSKDRRVRLIEITDRGGELRTRILERLHEPLPWMLALSREEQRRLRDLLRKALDSVSGRPSEP
jgi:DNA-binding MarR family transcriptional regulator